jgi:hypothetical protein
MVGNPDDSVVFIQYNPSSRPGQGTAASAGIPPLQFIASQLTAVS